MRPGRLDSLVYIPLPDLPSRKAVFKASLRKSPVAKDVDIDFLAQATDKFTGADITEICQRAARLAIREAIEAKIQADKAREAAKALGQEVMEEVDVPDTVPEISRVHFEAAMRDARRSVSDADLARYSSFAQTMAQQRAAIGAAAGISGGLGNFRFPTRDAGGAAGEGGAAAPSAPAPAGGDDDDLYS